MSRLQRDFSVMGRKSGSDGIDGLTCPLSLQSLVKVNQSEGTEGLVLGAVVACGAYIDPGKGRRHAVHVVAPENAGFGRASRTAPLSSKSRIS